MLYNEILYIWLNKYIKNSVKEKTYILYKYLIDEKISKYFLDCKTTTLSIDFIQNYIINLSKEYSSNTILLIITILKQSLRYAYMVGYIKKDFSYMIKSPKKTEKNIEIFNYKEQKKIIDYCLQSNKNKTIGILICLLTGIRIGELLALTWDDIDFNSVEITINKTMSYIKSDTKYITKFTIPKTKTSIRKIPVSNVLLSRLKSIQNNSISNYVISTKHGSFVSIRNYQRYFENILNKLNIPKKSFHSLRHTFATNALEIGINIKALQEILGHSSPTITLNRYSHTRDDYKIFMMKKLNKSILQNNI